MNKRHALWSGIVILLFLAMRWLAVKNAGSFWFDEAFSVHFASLSLKEMWGFLRFEHNPLVHFLILHGWIKILGAGEIATRFLSLLAGFLSLIMIYLLGNKLFNKQVGLWTAFLMTLSTLFLYHQTEARMYALVMLFGLISMYAFLRVLIDLKPDGFCRLIDSAGKRGYYFWLSLYVFSAVLLVNTHITAWSLIVALSVVWFVEMGWKKWKQWLVAHFFIVAVFLWWFVPVFLNKLEVGRFSQGWFLQQTEQGFWLKHVSGFFLNGESSLWLTTLGSLVVGWLIVAGFVRFECPSWLRKVKSVFERNNWPFSLTLDWSFQTRFLLVCLLVPLSLGFALQVTVTKYVLLAAIPTFLLAAKALSERSGLSQVVLTGVLIILVLPLHLRLYTQPRHQWDQVADKLLQLQNQYPDAILVAHSFAWSLPLIFYFDDWQEIKPFYPLEDKLDFNERVVRYNWQAIVNDQNVEKLKEVVGGANEVVLISSTPGQRDPVKEWFWKKGWRLTESFVWAGYGDPEVMVFQK